MTDGSGQRHDARRLYDRISRIYDLLANSSERTVREFGIRALGVSRGQRVLEIGCGTGHGLVTLAEAVGDTGRVYGIDISPGMLAVARTRLRAAGMRNVRLAIGDASALGSRSNVFDAVFMSFTLELFDATIPTVLCEVRRVLRVGGRVGIVAMAEAGRATAAVDAYQWLRRQWPQFIDCQPIDAVGVLEQAQFHILTAHATTIWGLPVVAAVGLKPSARQRRTGAG